MTLKDKTLFISGGSRGIGLEIALRAARDGANVALIAKTGEPHPHLPGTVFTAAEAIEAAGGRALPIVGDIRDASQVESAVAATVERFGGVDVCVNNASRDQPGGHRGARHEALRPHAGHQHARDVRREPRLHPASQAGGEPAHPHAVAADQPRTALARPARRLHDRQVRHEPVRARLRRGAPGRRDRVQRAVAAHADRDRGGAEPPRRRRGDGRIAQAASSTRTPPTPSSPGRAGSAPATPSSARTCSPRRASPTWTLYAYVPGSTPQVDLFVDHV